MANISKILSHPLTIAAATAILSLVLVPSFTQRWQDHQRELDIKTRLVTEMTEAVAEPIANSRVWSRGATVGSEMPSYSQTLRNIDTSGARVGALLRAYFPEQPDLFHQWISFARALNYCIRLTAADDPSRKASHLKVVREYVDQSGGTIKISWDALVNSKWHEGFGPDFENAYETLTDWMLEQDNKIVQKVLASKANVSEVLPEWKTDTNQGKAQSASVQRFKIVCGCLPAARATGQFCVDWKV